jgi:hypothetical protein
MPGTNQKKIATLSMWTCSKECQAAFQLNKNAGAGQQDGPEPTLKDVYQLLVGHINQQKETMAKMDGEITRLKIQLNAVKQRNISRNIVIAGLDNNITDIEEVFVKINRIVEGGVPVGAVDFEKITKKQQKDSNRQPTALLRATFSSIKHKADFMSAVKQHGPILSTEIFPSAQGTSHGPKRLAIRDELTPYYDKLFYESRRFGKEHGYKYVWYKYQKIHVRKAENSKIFSFESFEKFEEFKQKMNIIVENINKN